MAKYTLRLCAAVAAIGLAGCASDPEAMVKHPTDACYSSNYGTENLPALSDTKMWEMFCGDFDPPKIAASYNPDWLQWRYSR